MSSGVAPYRAAVAQERARLTAMLADGRSPPYPIGLARLTASLMARIVDTAPGSALIYDRLGADPKTGLDGPDRLTTDMRRKAALEIHPEDGTSEQMARKYSEYLDLSLKIRQWGRVRQELITDTQRGRQYLIFGANPLVPKINAVVASALLEWVNRQENTRAYLNAPTTSGLADLLAERPDLVALMRLGQTLPLDVEISDVPVDRPASVEAIELVIGLIPVVGNAVALYESWSGVDLFGYHLSDLERGILAASVLLPVAGRLAKGGRALYTEARLVSMYGRDAAAWSRAVRPASAAWPSVKRC